MTPYSESMPQVATYWPPGSNDGFGGLASGPPCQTSCRWQDEGALYRDPKGRELISKSVIYTARPVAVGGFLALGQIDSQVPTPEALEIRQISVTPSLDGDEALHKAFGGDREQR